MAGLEVKIASNAREIEEAQRLRFQVFNLELNKGLQASYRDGIDIDEFDAFCDHLIVRDLNSGDIVGTYRLMRSAQARKNIGFYSEKEFDLARIKELDGEFLELGRSCARKDFRDRALIPLMWNAIADYVKLHHVRYLFGCGSLYTTDPLEVGEVFALLQRKYYAPEEQRVYPTQEFQFDGIKEFAAPPEDSGLFQKLPSLIKSYLRVGAVVCGPPALDRDFGTADFFLLLDFYGLKEDYLNRLGLGHVQGNDALD